MAKSDIAVRRFTRKDVPQLLALMRELAIFEDYIDDFNVSEEDIVKRGLGPSPQFEALVAEDGSNDRLLGMAVLYTIPFSHDLRPTLVMKELYVAQDARSGGVGRKLFAAVAVRARELDCFRMIWTVLADNHKAKAFYQQHNGRCDEKWEGWILDEAGLARLESR